MTNNKKSNNNKQQFESKVITLDGKQNYISVNVLTDNRQKSLYPLKIHKNSDETARFMNYEIAKLTASKMLDPSRHLEYIIHIGDMEVNMNDTQRVGNHYQYYDNENHIKYYIRDRKIFKLVKAGYICFEHGDTQWCDKEYGIKRQHQLLKWILEIVDQNISVNKSVGILSKKKISSKEYVLQVKDSTAQIRILTNSRFMDINQERREKNQKVIPYIRKVDKFVTFTVLVTKDTQERMSFDTDKRVNVIINDIIVALRNDLPGTSLDEINPAWVETEFNGFVKFDENNN